jgi:hypothetical protein
MIQEELLTEIPDSEIKWEEELKEAYIENGKEYFLEDLIDDFYIFCEYMFTRAGFDAPTTIQKMIIDFIAKDTKKHKLIQAPRGSGKSYISQLKVLWDMLRDNNHHILIRSASKDRSSNYTTFLLNTIKTTPLLQHLSPRGTQRKSKELFDVNGAKPSDSPSVMCKPIGGTVTGLRSTFTVLDDIEVIGNSSSPLQRETLTNNYLETFNLSAKTVDEDGNKITGKTLVLGTFQSSDSIYVPMIRSGAYETLIIPAEYPPVEPWYEEFVSESIMNVSRKNPEMIGLAIDERLDDEYLAEKKKLSRSNYELHYMLNPNLTDEFKYPLKLRDLIVTDIDPIDNPIRMIYSSVNKIFDIKHRGFPSDYLVSPASCSEERDKFQFTVLAIDPSGRGQDETGYCVVSLLGGKIFIRDFGGLKGGYEDESLLTLVGISKQYEVNKIIVESNFGDGAYAKMLSTKLDESYPEGYPELEDVRAVGQKEVRIIDTLEPLMNQHRIIIDRVALLKDYEKKTDYSLTFQMSHITKQPKCLVHDDIIDVIELGVRDIVEYLAKGDKTSMQRYKEERQKQLDELFEKGFFHHLVQQPTKRNWMSSY